MDALTKEKKKRLMQWSKGELAERLLFAYSTIQSLEAEKLQLAKMLELNGVKNTEQANQHDLAGQANVRLTNNKICRLIAKGERRWK